MNIPHSTNPGIGTDVWCRYAAESAKDIDDETKLTHISGEVRIELIEVLSGGIFTCIGVL